MKIELPKGMQHREAVFDRALADTEKRTVALSFSSEDPYERYFGIEVLDHDAKSVRLGRMKGGAAVLVNHRMDDHVGVVESVSIDGDRVGRAVVRFGKSARAEEIYQDVLDGIRKHVSVGYMVHKMVMEELSDAGEVYRVTDWEPFEISIVGVPADATVGVGREAALEPKEPKKMTTEPEVVKAPDPAIATAAARDAETSRIRDINAIGKQFAELTGGETAKMADAAISSGKPTDQFRSEVLAKLAEKRPVPTAELGLSEREIKQFSFVRALHALANPHDRAAQDAAGYERDVSNAAAKAAGKAPQGIMVPVDVLRAPMQRDLVVGTSTAGGHTVSTDLLAQSFIEMLRNQMVLVRAGVTMLNGLVGSIAIPRQTSGATAYWVAESGAPTESQQAFDQVTMAPKTVGAFTDFSRKLLLQSSIDVEAFVRSDLVKQIGIEIDRAGLYGSGSSNQPTGVKSQTGVLTVDFAAAAPTYAEVVAMETAIAAVNADIGNLAYITNAAGRGALKTTEKASSTGIYLWETGGTVNGYRTEISNQVASGDYWFGNWADVLIGMWSGLDLTVDPYTGATSGTVRVIGLQDVDVAVRRGPSFCRGNNTL